MNFKCKTYACDEIITVNNVKALSEYLKPEAFLPLRKFLSYSHFLLKRGHMFVHVLKYPKNNQPNIVTFLSDLLSLFLS